MRRGLKTKLVIGGLRDHVILSPVDSSGVQYNPVESSKIQWSPVDSQASGLQWIANWTGVQWTASPPILAGPISDLAGKIVQVDYVGEGKGLC